MGTVPAPGMSGAQHERTISGEGKERRCGIFDVEDDLLVG